MVHLSHRAYTLCYIMSPLRGFMGLHITLLRGFMGLHITLIRGFMGLHITLIRGFMGLHITLLRGFMGLHIRPAGLYTCLTVALREAISPS